MIHECTICHRIKDCGMCLEECDRPIKILMNCRDINTGKEFHTKEYVRALNL